MIHVIHNFDFKIMYVLHLDISFIVWSKIRICKNQINIVQIAIKNKYGASNVAKAFFLLNSYIRKLYILLNYFHYIYFIFC